MSRTSAVSPDNFTTFGDLLKHLRKQAGLTQLELSIAVGYSDTQISRMEQNQRVPDAATLTARFVPALHIEREPQWVTRLLELAADARRVDGLTPTTDIPVSSAPRHNLPLQLTNFIGREAQIAEVRRYLQSTRLLTLTGPGGTGKTRLALQIGEESLGDFAHGVWLVELAPIAEPTQVPQAVAQALALRADTAEAESSSRDALSLIVEHFGGKRLLLILDNCEHLVEACAQLAEQLLRAAPGLSILATSREALGVGGERSYPVPGLSVPEAGERLPLEAMAESEAVSLFVERAAAMRPDFALAEENAQAVVQICQRLDGIPLAIELAAARARALSVEQIAALLDNRFQLLTGGRRTAPQRQQTLRGAIDWSYDLLADGERALLRRLSVFAGGWGLAAAMQMVDGSDAIDWLDQLVAKSLVLSDQPPGQAARFRMLETIREYAQEKLVQAGEEEDAHHRHLAFYVSLAEQAEPELRGHGQTKWVSRLDREHDNLRAALAWAIKAQDVEAALRLAGALVYFWAVRNYGAEGRRWLEAALNLQTSHGTPEPSAWRAKALLGAGWLDRDKDLNVSLSWLKQGLAIYQEMRDKAGMAYGLYLLGQHRQAGEQDYPRALEHYQQALDLWTEVEDGWGIGICLHWMGHMVEEMGDYIKAGEFYQRSVEILRQEGDLFQLRGPLNDLVSRNFVVGDIAGARAFAEESLAVFEPLGVTSGFNASLNWLAYISIVLGDYADARVRALALQNVRGSQWDVANGRVYLGQIDYLQGQLAEAQPHFEAAIEICRELKDVATSLATNWMQPWLACVAYRLGDLERAKTLLYESVENSADKDHREIRHALLARGHVARAEGDVVAATEYYARSLRVIIKNDMRWDVADRLESFAQLATMAQQPHRATRLLGGAHALREQLHIPIPPIERPEYEQALVSARAQLDPAEFDAAWAEGSALSWEQAAAYALNEIEI